MDGAMNCMKKRVEKFFLHKVKLYAKKGFLFFRFLYIIEVNHFAQVPIDTRRGINNHD